MKLTIEQRRRAAIATMAMYRARALVAQELKRHRIRLADTEPREIASWARVYLDEHPEVVAEATETVDLWEAQGRWGPRGGFRSR
jgi:hypothetical protein